MLGRTHILHVFVLLCSVSLHLNAEEWHYWTKKNYRTFRAEYKELDERIKRDVFDLAQRKGDRLYLLGEDCEALKTEATALTSWTRRIEPERDVVASGVDCFRETSGKLSLDITRAVPHHVRKFTWSINVRRSVKNSPMLQMTLR